MIIKTTVTFEYRLDDDQVEQFRDKVLECIQDELEELGEKTTVTLDDVPTESVKEYLNRELPNIIDEIKQGYCYGGGVEFDDYFGTISLDYYGDDVRCMIRECAEEIREEK